MRPRFAIFFGGLVLACAVFGGDAALGEPYVLSGPPREMIDGNAGTGVSVSLHSHLGGIIERDTDEAGVELQITTNAVFADNLQIFLAHDGIEVEIYNGAGNTEMAQIIATFASDATIDPPTEGSVTGVVIPVGDLDAFRGRDIAGTWTLRFVDAMGNLDETRLDGWQLRGEIEESGPTRSVALFFNPIYVDAVDETGDIFADAEALNLEALIEDLGHSVETFTDISAAGWAAALAGKDALVIPSLEGPNLVGRALHPDLSAAARDEIRNFVEGGGLLITSPTLFGHNGDLVSELFFGGACTFKPQQPTQPPVPSGCVYSSNGSTTSLVTEDALGTPFQGASGGLPANIIARGLINLPPEATVSYDGILAGGTAANVVSLPVPSDGSGGQVIWLANDFFNSVPLGTSALAWPQVLDRALTDDLAPFFTQQRVALFNNPTYVDAVDDAANLESDLLDLGHVVQPFSGIDVGSINTALASADVVAIPDLEVDNNGTPGPDFVDDLSSESEIALFDYVRAGGVLITHAATAETFLENLLGRDPLFAGSNAIDLVPIAGGLALANSITGTGFAEPALTLEENTNTDGFGGLPSEVNGGSNVFSIGASQGTVALFRVGAGQVIWLGWDWEDGAADGNWVDTLGRAVSAAGPVPMPAPEPGATGAAAAVLATLFGLWRRRR